MPPIKRQPRGWVLPGYRYLGPFNPLDNGEPVNNADRAAQLHDHAYSELIKSGKNPYLYFNKADEKFIDDLKDDWSIGGIIGSSFFKIKRAVAPALGNKERAQKRHFYFANSNKGAKKTKKSEPKPGTSKMSDTDIQDQQPDTVDAPQNTSGGGTGSIGGGKGSGVGISTGGWVGGSHFSDKYVVTKNTRQFITTIQNGHLYKTEAIETTNQSGKSQRCVTTPWTYFNFNQYSCHFSPQDWQRLTNEYKRFRPKAMQVKIYNLQIKQILSNGADTTYNNDLTAGVHIFCDGEHAYPNASHPWDEDVMPDLPYKTWKLFQYGYIPIENELADLDGNAAGGNATEKALLYQMPFFLLENSDHQVLRTGESTEFTFNFDCEWVNNERAYIPPGLMFNPKVPTRRVQYIRQNGSTAASTGRIQPYSKPTSWMTGPGLLSAQRVGPQSSDTAPFMVCTNPEGTHINTGAAGFGSGFDPPSGCLAPTNLEYKLQWYQTPEGTGNNGNIIANPSLSMLRDQLLYKGNQTTYNLVGDIWMFPNQIWDRFPITRENPIWCKKPRADKHTIMDPFDGSIAMDHPPGTIFIKMAKIPVPTASNADSYLNIYCTGQVSCEIVWEVERYATKNWRPERRHTALGMSLGGESNYTPTYHVDPTGAYIQPTSYDQCMPVKTNINKVL